MPRSGLHNPIDPCAANDTALECSRRRIAALYLHPFGVRDSIGARVPEVPLEESLLPRLGKTTPLG